jgi:hypothetical protein
MHVWASKDLAWRWEAYLQRGESEAFVLSARDLRGNTIMIRSQDVNAVAQAHYIGNPAGSAEPD